MRTRLSVTLLLLSLPLATGCADQFVTEEGPDVVAPVIALSAPASGSTVTQPEIVLRGTATDEVGISRMSYRLNGEAEQEIFISRGTTVDFEITVPALEPGANTLAISAFDAAENHGEVQRHVDYAVVRYHVVVAGGQGSGWSFAGPLTARGDLAGTRTPGREEPWGYPERDTHGFILSGSEMRDLLPPEGFVSSSVLGINSSHVSAGRAVARIPNELYDHGVLTDFPVVWENDRPHVLPLLPGYVEGGASAINDAGIVVGYLTDSEWEDWAPVLWREGEPTKLTDIRGVASDINASGVVTGMINTGRLPRAFRWENGQMVALEPLDGFNGSRGFTINDLGEVAGYSFSRGPEYGNTRATLWRGTTAVSLGEVPRGVYYRTWGINNVGQAVGHADWETGEVRRGAFLSQNGRMSLLSHLTPSEWVIIEATAINDAGQIAAYALHAPSGKYYAVRLDFVDAIAEPASHDLSQPAGVEVSRLPDARRGARSLLERFHERGYHR